MKYLKMFGLAAVAAAALMAFAGAGSASATVLCHGEESPCSTKWTKNTEVEFILKPFTVARWFTTQGITLNECSGGSLRGTIVNAGSATETVVISVAKESGGFNWSSCTTNQVTVEGGEIEIHSITGSTNGTATMKGFKFRTDTTQYGTCYYGAGTGVHLGKIVASKTGHAIIDIEVVLIKLAGSAALCPNDIEWWEEWEQSAPKETAFFVEPS